MSLKAKLRRGFTTGTCAQAAAKAAAVMLVTQKPLKRVVVETPSGKKLNLKLIGQKIRKNFAKCGIVKIAGDDPDVTDGTKIYSEVRFSNEPGIAITGGKGVGRVTKPGLAVGVGECAINPTPRKMIIKEVTPYLPKNKGLEVVISAPEGKKLARQTFNPRLGIVGGISIIGTTGIVEPKSIDAYKASLSLQSDVLRAQGSKKAILVLGYVGERFCRDILKLDDDSMIKIGDHVGFMVEECKKKGIKEIFLIGHLGKLVKVANGQFNTHSRFGDERIETIARYARLSGANKMALEDITRQRTAEAAIEILRKNKLEAVFHKIAQEVVKRLKGLLNNQLEVSCLLLSLKGEPLAWYPERYRHE